jgi:hypothetical protein
MILFNSARNPLADSSLAGVLLASHDLRDQNNCTKFPSILVSIGGIGWACPNLSPQGGSQSPLGIEIPLLLDISTNPSAWSLKPSLSPIIATFAGIVRDLQA